MNREGHNLRSFLHALRNTGQITNVDQPLSTKFEVAAIEKALEDDKAVVINRPTEGKFPIVANLLISRSRFSTAISMEERDVEAFFLSSLTHASKPKRVNEGRF